MLGRTVLSLIVTLLLSVVAAHAECFGKTAKSVMANPHEELVFVGTVVDVTRAGALGQRATFQVTRVWKGSVPERFDLYVWELTEGRPHFEKGQRHMGFAAMAKDPRVLQEVGRDSSKEPTFIATSCSELLSLSPTIERDLGPGYEPQRQTKGPADPEEAA